MERIQPGYLLRGGPGVETDGYLRSTRRDEETNDAIVHLTIGDSGGNGTRS